MSKLYFYKPLLMIAALVVLSNARAYTMDPLVCKPGSSKSKSDAISQEHTSVSDDYINGYYRYFVKPLETQQEHEKAEATWLGIADHFRKKLAEAKQDLTNNKDPMRSSDLRHWVREAQYGYDSSMLEVLGNRVALERLLGKNNGRNFTATGRELVEAQVRFTAKDIKSRSYSVDCGLTDIEIFSIVSYTGDTYKQVNEAMRAQSAEDLQFIIREVISGLNKLAPYKAQVFRSASLSNELLRQHCVNCVVTMSAFTSTSRKLIGFPGKHKFIIQSKSGRYVAPLAHRQSRSEEEVLFLPQSRFRVISTDGTNFVMEELE